MAQKFSSKSNKYKKSLTGGTKKLKKMLPWKLFFYILVAMETNNKNRKNNKMKIIKKLAGKKYFKWWAFVFIISTILIENPWFGQEYLRKITGGVGMIDMNLFNSPGDIIHYLTSIGEDGRNAYLRLLGLDFLLIISFFIFTAIIIYRLINCISLSGNYIWLILFPLFRAVFDCLETITMVLNTLLYPNSIAPIIYLASAATSLKWLFFAATAITLIGLLLIYFGQKIIFRGHYDKATN
jgi:hypothetical protein